MDHLMLTPSARRQIYIKLERINFQDVGNVKVYENFEICCKCKKILRPSDLSVHAKHCGAKSAERCHNKWTRHLMWRKQKTKAASREVVRNLFNQFVGRGERQERESVQLQSNAKTNCLLCTLELTCQAVINNHINNDHQDEYGNIVCPFQGCGKTFKFFKLLEHHHWKINSGVGQLVHTFCSHHVLACHLTKFTCDLCGWQTHHKSDLERHINMHREAFERNACAGCGGKITAEMLERKINFYRKSKKCQLCDNRELFGRLIGRFNNQQDNSQPCKVCKQNSSQSFNLKRRSL